MTRRFKVMSMRLPMRCALMGALAVALLISISFALAHASRSPTLSEPARKAISAAFPTAVVQQVESEKLVVEAFDVELLIDGQQVEALVTSDGVIVAIERRTDVAKLPADVRDGLTKAAAGAPLDEIEEIEKLAEIKAIPLEKPAVVFEAEVEIDGTERTIRVDQNGNPLKNLEGDEDRDDDEDEEDEDEDDD